MGSCQVRVMATIDHIDLPLLFIALVLPFPGAVCPLLPGPAGTEGPDKRGLSLSVSACIRLKLTASDCSWVYQRQALGPHCRGGTVGTDSDFELLAPGTDNDTLALTVVVAVGFDILISKYISIIYLYRNVQNNNN